MKLGTSAEVKLACRKFCLKGIEKGKMPTAALLESPSDS
jgi:hypothetical protein